ncbi:hypothetical protein [Micromonospora sagamiensis]|uniref:CU044_5270 family protein n=1 Tax=Micromonospora sagamiensis TaxID=47875 RepID=A0A562WQ01_9ACTN|nr:hypothetical protein [Micromonospora sagamiensis]TWJ32305.1 hypothetical protein JD81_05880 [Micromonospora sagamiensis]BCL14630.1 hypothetical protein GCM10017556_23690 [Micromonospora sagamiensis]
MTPLDASAPQRRKGNLRLPPLMVALLAVTTALTAVIAYSNHTVEHHPPAEPTAIPAGWSKVPGDTPTPAIITAPCLAELADVLSAAAGSSSSASATPARPARYARTHTRAWAAQDTLKPSGNSSRTIVTTETWQWRAADGSGRTVSTTPGSAGHAVTDHLAGGIPAPLPEPTPTDPYTLATHLAAVQPPEMGPQWIIRAVADVHLTQHPAPATRIALLRLLATAEAVVCHGTAADRAGRAGTAVAVEHQQARDTLIIDRTGWVLAHESTDLGSPSGMDKNAPRLRSYTLIIDRSAETTIDTAEATR